ncbi:MAG: hypothetical protein AAGB97_00560 [Dehalococcoidia bacterium]
MSCIYRGIHQAVSLIFYCPGTETYPGRCPPDHKGDVAGCRAVNDRQDARPTSPEVIVENGGRGQDRSGTGGICLR